MLKVKLRLGDRPLRRSPGVIRKATIVYTPPPQWRRRQAQVLGAPREHVSRRKRRHFTPPTRHTKGYGPIRHPVSPKPFKPFCGPNVPLQPDTRNASTQTIVHDKLHPKASTYTRGDVRKDKAIGALQRLKKATPLGFHWTSNMILVLLRFTFGLLVSFNWGWTQAVTTIADLCCVRKHTVFKFVNDYINNPPPSFLPVELPQATRGRGSINFIENHGKDHFSALKEVKTVFALLFDCSFFLLSTAGASEDNCRVC